VLVKFNLGTCCLTISGCYIRLLILQPYLNKPIKSAALDVTGRAQGESGLSAVFYCMMAMTGKDGQDCLCEAGRRKRENGCGEGLKTHVGRTSQAIDELLSIQFRGISVA